MPYIVLKFNSPKGSKLAQMLHISLWEKNWFWSKGHSCIKLLFALTLFFFPETISSIPLQLEEDDIEDFCSLAQYYASRTPQSFRKVGATAVFFDVAFFF